MNGPNPTGNVCPKCGARLPAGAPEGLCPACLLAMNLAAPTDLSEAYGPHGTRVERTPPLMPPRPEEIAHLFPQLEILESLGRGGMGVVYKARQKSLDRFVALKLLAPERARDPEFAARFQREAHALARLSHPNIVTIHDFGQAGDFYFLLMEYVDGVNLRQLLRAKKLSPEEALAIVPSLCDALQYAHERGIVHRDIKPENLLLDRTGRAKIADFGIAKLIGGPAAGSGTVDADADAASRSMVPEGEGESPGLHSQNAAGTPGYMAPEQKSAPHQVDSRADIYSLGVVLYEMLTGERPTGPIEPPSSRIRGMQIDVRLDQVVLRALENEPDLRWQSAADLRTQIQLLTGLETAPSRASTAPSPARHVLRGLLVGLAVLVTGTWLALGVAFLSPQPRIVVLWAGALAAFLAAIVSGWTYAVRSKRNAGQHGTKPPLFLTTAPHLGLALVIASLVVPLGLGGTLSTAARMRLAAERRSQIERKVAAEQGLAAAQKQVNDLAAQSQEAQRTLKQLREAPVPDENALTAAEERVKELAAKNATAEADRQSALRRKENAEVRFHSEAHPGWLLYVLPILLFALPGTILGWRHLLAIRGLSRPRRCQSSAMIAALTWPLLILATSVGLIVLLPLNHGVWATLGLVLAMLAVLGTLGWSIARVLRWIDGQPFFPSGQSATAGVMPGWAVKWFGILLLALAVLVPLRWFTAVRSDNSRELARWQMEMTRLQREWTSATTDRFWAQTALDRHSIAAANLTTPQERVKAESERQKLTRALGRAEALVATLDVRMRSLNEATNRQARTFEQLIAPLLFGAVLGFCGLLLLRRAGAPQSGSTKRTPVAWFAVSAIVLTGVCALLVTFSHGTRRDSGAMINAQAQAQQDASANAPSPLPPVRAAPEGDLLAQAEMRVLQAQYEKLLNELMNAESERDLLATRTGVSKEVLDRESKDLQEKIRILSDQRDTLRRKIETLKP